MFLPPGLNLMRQNTQRSVFIAFLVLLSAGCWNASGIHTLQAHKQPQSLGFSPWNSLSLPTENPSSRITSILLAATARTTSSQAKLLIMGVTNDGELVAGGGHTLQSIGQTLSPPPKLATFGRRYALVAWSSGSSIFIKRLDTSESTWELQRVRSRPTSLAFHQNDTSLLIGGADGRVYRWRYLMEDQDLSPSEREKTLERYIGHHTIISHVLSIPEARPFLSTDWDGRILAWLPYSADSHGGRYDKNLFAGRFFGTVGTSMAAPRKQDRGITAVTLSQNGRKMALGTDDGYVEIWDIRGFEMSARHKAHTGRVLSVSLNHDGTTVASLGKDEKVWVANIEDDSLYRIAPAATRQKLVSALTENHFNLHTLFFTARYSLTLVSDNGDLEERILSKPSHIDQPSHPPKSALDVFQKDSDY
jgi:WD40 repeat protein